MSSGSEISAPSRNAGAERESGSIRQKRRRRRVRQKRNRWLLKLLAYVVFYSALLLALIYVWFSISS